MLRYYQRVTNAQIRHAKGIKPGSGAHTPKKYDKAHLSCTVAGCDENFWVSYANTPAKRRCEFHHFNEPVSDKQKALDILKSLC